MPSDEEKVVFHLPNVKPKPYYLAGFPDAFASEMIIDPNKQQAAVATIKMGKMTKQAIENGLDITRQRLVVLVFRSKTNPDEIYYDLMPTWEITKNSSPEELLKKTIIHDFITSLNLRLCQHEITVEAAGAECKHFSKNTLDNTLIFIIDPFNKVTPYQSLSTPDTRGTGVVHDAAISFMQYFYGYDTVPAIDEPGLLAGSFEINSQGTIELITRSNLINSKSCVYKDEILLLAMRHCFIPLNADDDALQHIVKTMSQKKLDKNGPFSLFMTDLLCQLPLEFSELIYDAIRRDVLPETKSYTPSLNENNKIAMQFRDDIYPELIKNKEKLLDYLLIQLILSSSRAMPYFHMVETGHEKVRQLYTLAEIYDIEYDIKLAMSVYLFKDQYHPQTKRFTTTYFSNPDWHYPTIERYLIHMTAIAYQWAKDNHSNRPYHVAKEKIIELLNRKFPCGPEGELQTVLENAIYRYDKTLISLLIRYGARLTQDDIDNNKNLNDKTLAPFVIKALENEKTKKPAFIMHFFELFNKKNEEIEIKEDEPAWSILTNYIESAANKLCNDSYLTFEFYSREKWMLSCIADCIIHEKWDDLDLLLKNNTLKNHILQYSHISFNFFQGMKKYDSLISLLQNKTILFSSFRDNQLVIDILPDELRHDILNVQTSSFVEKTLSFLLNNHPEELPIFIQKIMQYSQFSIHEIVKKWLFEKDNINDLYTILKNNHPILIINALIETEPLYLFVKSLLTQTDDPSEFAKNLLIRLNEGNSIPKSICHLHQKEFTNALIWLFTNTFRSDPKQFIMIANRLSHLKIENPAELYRLCQKIIEYQREFTVHNDQEKYGMNSFYSILNMVLYSHYNNIRRQDEKLNTAIPLINRYFQKLSESYPTFMQLKQIPQLVCIYDNLIKYYEAPNDPIKTTLMSHIQVYLTDFPLAEKTSFNLYNEPNFSTLLNEAFTQLQSHYQSEFKQTPSVTNQVQRHNDS